MVDMHLQNIEQLQARVRKTEDMIHVALTRIAGVTGSVLSVFGRTGAVVAATNDYAWAQIDKTTSDIADITTKSHASLTSIGTNTHAQIDTHVASTSNPHSTSDANLITTDVTTND